VEGRRRGRRARMRTRRETEGKGKDKDKEEGGGRVAEEDKEERQRARERTRMRTREVEGRRRWRRARARTRREAEGNCKGKDQGGGCGACLRVFPPRFASEPRRHSLARSHPRRPASTTATRIINNPWLSTQIRSLLDSSVRSLVATSANLRTRRRPRQAGNRTVTE
jgi:hypothetical protein